VNTFDPDALSARQSAQLGAFTRYLAAMERGDADALAAILREANDDPTLERLILALHEVYDEVDATEPTFDEVAQAQASLKQYGAAEAIEATVASANGNAQPTVGAAAESRATATGIADVFGAADIVARNGATHTPSHAVGPTRQTAQPIPFWRRLAGQSPHADATALGDEIIMDTRDIPDDTSGLSSADQQTSVATSEAPSDVRRANTTTTRRRSRGWLRVAQGLVAAVIVVALVGAFLTIFQRLGGSQPHGTSGQGTPAATAPHYAFAGSWDGVITALSPDTGGVIWRYTTGTRYPIAFLVAQNGTLYAADGYSDSPTIIWALNVKDGALLWKKQIGAFGGFPYPFLVDQGVIITDSSHGTIALRGSDGAQLWNASYGQLNTAGDGVAYVWFETHSLPTSVTDTSTTHEMLRALRVTDGKTLWQLDGGNNQPMVEAITPQVAYVAYYGGNAPSVLKAVNDRTGVQIWQTRFNNLFQVVASDGSSVYTTPYGNQFCRWDLSKQRQVWCLPSLAAEAYGAANGALYLARIDGDNVNNYMSVGALNSASGKQLWYQRLGKIANVDTSSNPGGLSIGGVNPVMVVQQQYLFIATTQGVWAARASDGHFLWHTLTNDVYTSIALA